MAKKAISDKLILAGKLRAAIGARKAISEKPMFGGVCFMLNEHMLCGTGSGRYMFRVGLEGEGEALSRPGAERMSFNSREYKGYVWVDPDACAKRDLVRWIALAEAYVGALPPKRKKVAGKRTKRAG